MRIKNNFEQEQQPGEPTLLNFKTYYKATVTRQCGIDKQTHRSNGTQYRIQKQSHTDTKNIYIYIFGKVSKSTEKGYSFQQMMLD